MRATFVCLAATFLLICSSGCHGGGSPTESIVPRTESASSFVQAALGTPRLWFSSCATCGIAMVPNKEVDLQAYSLSGTDLHDFAFSGGNGSPALDAVNPDQQHVYVTIFRGDENFVADVDTVTYKVRYYTIPLTEQQGYISGLVVSPDGRRLYVTTSVKVFVINTVTRTYAGTSAAKISAPALSPDGKTLYGITSAGVAAIDTATLAVRSFAFVTGANAVAATSSTVYVATNNGVRAYNAKTRNCFKTILSGLFERLVVDPSIARLYAWFNGPTSQSVFVVDTATHTTVKTLPNFFQGPFLDPVTHRIYGIDVPGNVCAYNAANVYAVMRLPSKQLRPIRRRSNALT